MSRTRDRHERSEHDGVCITSVAAQVEQARALLADASAQLSQLRPRDEDAEALLAAIDAAESVKAVVAAVQMRAEIAFRSARIAVQRDAGVPRAELGRGVAEEVALARRISPARCRNEMALHRVVVDSLPYTLDLLEQGQIAEWSAREVAKAVTTLEDPDRARVDADLAARLPDVSPPRAGALARARAAELDPEAAIARMRREENERHVSVRPVSDAMVQLTAVLPSAAGIAVFAALDRAATVARASGTEGTRGQHMADALFSRVTGLTAPEECTVEIQLLMTDQSLLAGSEDVAWVDGHPLPASIARRFALGDTHVAIPAGSVREVGQRFIRRLYTDPVSGRLRDADARRRSFSGHDRRLIEMAYQQCAMPWCEARIRHIHHVDGYAGGGATVLENGAGLCEHCNYLIERPGWTSRLVPRPDRSSSSGRTRSEPETGGIQSQVMEVTTPTGRVHRCLPPPLRAARAAPSGDDVLGRGERPDGALRVPSTSRTRPLHEAELWPPPGSQLTPPAWDDLPDPPESDISQDPLSEADWNHLVGDLVLSGV